MVHYRYPSRRRVQRKSRYGLFLTAALVAISMSPVVFYLNLQDRDPPVPGEVSEALSSPVAEQEAIETVIVSASVWSPVDPSFTLKPEALAFANNAPLASTFKPFNAPRTVAHAPVPLPPLTQEAAKPLQTAPEQRFALAIQPIPLPVPRPAHLRVAKAEAPEPETPRAARAPISTAMRVSAAPSQPENNPTFFEKLFGIKPTRPPENTLGYAALSTGSIAPSSRFNPSPMADNKTAVYDISAKIVIMPNGERLEAHSGLGDKMDDPRFVHVRMKGATPPGTYTLTEREALFHGVRAIRLNPIGGSAAIFGRNGILAHSYLLGPNGDSNGCVSFKDYNRFLQAFLRGEVRRMVVITGRGQDVLPRIVSRGRAS
jgi:hypothetical protein